MGFSPYNGMDVMFSIVPVIIFFGFIFIIGAIIVKSVQGAKQWKRNNDSPVLSINATVVTKRADVRTHYHGSGTNDIDHRSSSTTYYVTFEVESGDRMEFSVRDNEYGMLVENDFGKLTFQGTRYLGFERNRI